MPPAAMEELRFVIKRQELEIQGLQQQLQKMVRKQLRYIVGLVYSMQEENTLLIACKNVIKKCHSKFMYGGTYFFRNRRYIKSYAYFMLKQSYTYLKTMPNWIFQAQKHTVQSNQI